MTTKKTTWHHEQIDREIEKAVSEFCQPLMSNSKWVRLIDGLVKNIEKIKKIEFKRIQNDQIGELYLSGDMEFGFDYWQDGIEEHNSLCGSLAFKEIEYLIFPNLIDANNNLTQDVKDIEKIINSIGAFRLSIDESSLILMGYLK